MTTLNLLSTAFPTAFDFRRRRTSSSTWATNRMFFLGLVVVLAVVSTRVGVVDSFGVNVVSAGGTHRSSILTSVAAVSTTSSSSSDAAATRTAVVDKPLVEQQDDQQTLQQQKRQHEDDDETKVSSSYADLSTEEIKSKLLELIPQMTGKEAEFRTVEGLVNALESKYQSVQTLQFLNMILQGEWQLIFSTNLAGTPDPHKFRLCKLFQTIDCHGLQGKLVNTAGWDYVDEPDNCPSPGMFDANGSFHVKCTYQINQGARMVIDVEDHVLMPNRGSVIPKEPQTLVGLLHRSMPKTMFDPSQHAVDTTYLDTDLRIARYTGPRLEGIRDIFIRKGSIQLDAPTATPQSSSNQQS